MVGTSILLLLACGGILIQGRPRQSNYNANSNVNILSRRNANGISESEPNTLDHLYPNPLLEKIRRKMYDENNPSIAEVAVAAAEIAYVITNDVGTELSHITAVAVAQEIADLLRRNPTSGNEYGRRSYNANSNTNVIGGGYGGGDAGSHYRDHGVYGSALAEGPGGHALGYGSSFGGIAHARGDLSRYADEDEDEEEVEDETTKDIEIAADEVEEADEAEKEVIEIPASRSLGRTLKYPIGNGMRRNSNSNANNNISRRRNLRSSARRNSNVNSNSNITRRKNYRG